MRLFKLIFLPTFSICAFHAMPALALDPNGWCLPTDACMGSMKPIRDLGYEECESRCALSAPVEVNEMSATLFDRTCKGDWGARSERVLFIQTKASTGDQQVLMITNEGVEELKRCL